MLTFEDFQQVIEAALGSKGAADVCRAAGLPPTAISEIRHPRNKQPRWDRAVRLADALDLELVIRRKDGDDLRMALMLAIIEATSRIPGTNAVDAEALANQLVPRQRRWLRVFGAQHIEHHSTIVEVAGDALLKMGAELQKEMFSPEQLALLEASAKVEGSMLAKVVRTMAPLRNASGTDDETSQS